MPYTLPAHWSEDEVFANSITIHYYRTGGEKTPLVLLHGFTENGLSWSRVARALESAYDVIMVDARGHGCSSGPETGYTQDLLTRDVADLLHELHLSHAFVFGYSNGALTAAQLAADYPALVRAVVLEDPPWGDAITPPAMKDGEPWPGYNAWYSSWIAWHKALRTQTFEERVAASRQFLSPGAFEWPEEELMLHLEAQAQFNLDVLKLTPAFPTRTSWRPTVERIVCPILLLTSDPDQMPVMTPQDAQQVAATWRKGQHVNFAHTSHFLHHELQDERFDHFIEVIKAFLSENR